MTETPFNERILHDLGEEFVARIRRGERPAVGEYSSQYAEEHAAEIEDFLESIAMLEELKPSAEKPADSLPETFGRYQIEGLLGEGGMGAVYLAHDSQLGRKVALKTPKFGEHSDAKLIDRFYREARSAATLHHPNICPVYEVGEIDEIHYFSMAYIEGRPLSDYIRAKRSPPVPSVTRVVRKVALALYEAHLQGVVHRDLKPANIMIDRHKEPIVMDFGLARQFGMADSSELDFRASGAKGPSATTNFEARLTQDGTLIGSPGYMSPEQILGKHELIGPGSDIYSLGVLYFELLTGQLPFPGDGSFMSIATAVIHGDPPDAAELRPDLGSDVGDVCRKAMAKKTEDRYESMHEFAAALARLIKSDSFTPATVPDVGKRETPELVRAKEQCELARSLFQEGQFAASISILEKMTASESPNNQYTLWAKSELPKARAKADEAATGVVALDATRDDDFWNSDFGASAPTLDQTSGPTLPSPKKSRRAAVRSQWAYLAGSGIAVLILLAGGTFVGRRFVRGNRTKVAQPAPNSTVVEPDSPAADVADEPAANDGSPTNRLTAAMRLRRYDTNRDGKLSRAELRSDLLPPSGPVKRVAENFDNFDRFPRDGVLDEAELKRIAEMFARQAGRFNRLRGPRRDD
ncbi:MAG: protein kinase [Pirellulaceae bacterium]|nr:protein kinase [Pirellulaceae bacterium]